MKENFSEREFKKKKRVAEKMLRKYNRMNKKIR